MTPDDASRLARDGHLITLPLLPADLLADLTAACARLPAENAGRRPAGVRRVLEHDDAFARAASAPAVRAIAEAVLGPTARVVRSILFDKTPDANWDVLWHQDVTIAVRQRIDVPGFGPWSRKAGVPHVQPPAEVLERMLTVRLHVDPCGHDNGPLLVVPGSHRRGIVNVATLDMAWCERDAVACPVAAGATLVMRPLLLHASRKSTSPGHRRVLHLEFAADELPHGLEWAQA